MGPVFADEKCESAEQVPLIWLLQFFLRHLLYGLVPAKQQRED